jgi:myosin heavy subunit
MSEQELMSEEDKFFGVRTKIGGEQEQEEVVSAEAVEEEDDSSELGDEELQGYSKRVQKRINKLRYETHEERRKAENAEKMRDEAYRVAQQIAEKNKEYESLIGRGEEALINQIKERAALSLNQAKEQYRKAYEEGDTDNVVSAQEALTKATAELTEADRYAQNFSGQQQQQQQQQQQWQQQQQQQQQQQYQQQQQQQAVPRPDPETEEWAAANPWFMEDGYEEMTSLAYGKHASLVKQGVKPNSPEYFRQIDETVQRAFPDYDWQVGNPQQERTSTASQPSMVVAPTTRNNGAKPRTVKLSPTQRSLAKKLGLTEQQYAKYV